MRALHSLIGVALLVAACGDDDDSSAPPPEIFFEGYRSAIYEADEHWMCRRDLADDVCDRDLDTTIVEAGDVLTVEPHTVAADPDLDCLYIYPTTDLGIEGNAAFDGEYDEEIVTTRNQAARFSRVCEVYAPLYRQRTLRAPAGNFREIAYADVVDAFRYYLGNWNEGRPFTLIGHSQGAGHLRRLIAEEVDPVPGLRERMVSALLLGSSVIVPIGEDVGGSFQEIAACRSDRDVNCVISYASFRDTVPPPPSSLFGRTGLEGMQVLCTNPANLGGGKADLTPYFNVLESTQFGTTSPLLAWEDGVVDPPAITTTFVALPGLVSSECIFEDGASYLSLTVNADPSDQRADDVDGDITPEWGMHLIDANVAMGNLVAIVESQAAAWHAAYR